MTREEILKYFKDEFADEVKGFTHYHNMAKSLEGTEYRDLMTALWQMACDEFTHARFIHNTLLMEGIDIPDNEQMMWEKAKELFEVS